MHKGLWAAKECRVWEKQPSLGKCKIGCHKPNAQDLCVSGTGHTEEQMFGNMCVCVYIHIYIIHSIPI